jgi:hypothetical protein
VPKNQKRLTDFKVVEWVYTSSSDDPRLWEKRAKLKVHDLQVLEFPSTIEFDDRMEFDDYQ